MTRIAVILPAHDEAAWIDDCLSALLRSDGVEGEVSVVVVANACSDDTATRALTHRETARARGWTLTVIETPKPGKLGALNLGDAAADADIRVYLDADVTVSPGLLAGLETALATPEPAYASGVPEVTGPTGWQQLYTRFWRALPFVARGVPGFGLFAVNRQGRARWQAFPDIISDDTFVRLHFAPEERHRIAAGYRWPMVRGLRNLIRVRRRQDAGVRELRDRFPELFRNDGGTRPGLAEIGRLALRDPLGFLVYAGVSVLVRFPVGAGAPRWARGR